MNKKDKALKIAIEALGFEGVRDTEEYWQMMEAAINACKEALEQPSQEQSVFMDEVKFGQSFMLDGKHVPLENVHKQPAQEPVAWMSAGRILTDNKDQADWWIEAGGIATPLYTHPAQPLSDDEIFKLEVKFNMDDHNVDSYGFARAIEQAHEIGESDGQKHNSSNEWNISGTRD